MSCKLKNNKIEIGKPSRPIFSDHYVKGDLIGKGTFGSVFRAWRIDPEQHDTFAVKVIDLDETCKEELESQVNLEIEILKELRHDNIIQMYDHFVDGSSYSLVTEFLEGGDLYTRIALKTTYSEKDTRDTCKILFEAIAYCHERNIAHLDLKPKNLLLVVSLLKCSVTSCRAYMFTPLFP